MWGNLTVWARPGCWVVCRRAGKLTCDRGIIGNIVIIGITGIIGIIDHAEGQAGPHYCSRRTVLVCTKERSLKRQITTAVNWQFNIRRQEWNYSQDCCA